ncbi:MAG TPA: hypothetical protein VMS77_06865 [Conexivisphaerales archaeon]|nr:hypothetical protein [Conexivisphaerales archaeon]
MSNEKSVLRWGGLAGILGGVLFILTIVILVGFVQGVVSIARFPDVRAAVTLGDAIYLVADMMWVVLFLGLYRALRGTSLAPALFGTGLSLVGLVVYAVGALPPVALAPISNLYHAPGASPADQATLALLWQGIQGVFNETDTVGFVTMSVGLIVLGLAMLRTPAFGKVFGGLSVALGAAQALGISLFSVDSASFAPFGILAFIIFPIVFGWKLYNLTRATGKR